MLNNDLNGKRFRRGLPKEEISYYVGTCSRRVRNMFLGFRTGIPRVGFSHTAPVPVYTVTCSG